MDAEGSPAVVHDTDPLIAAPAAAPPDSNAKNGASLVVSQVGGTASVNLLQRFIGQGIKTTLGHI